MLESAFSKFLFSSPFRVLTLLFCDQLNLTSSLFRIANWLLLTCYCIKLSHFIQNFIFIKLSVVIKIQRVHVVFKSNIYKANTFHFDFQLPCFFLS